MKNKLLKVIICAMLASALALPVGCRSVVGGVSSSNQITILTTAMVGTTTTEDDPYKAYILENYGLDVTLIAATDFDTTVQLRFSNYEDMPDIVSFADIDSFRTIFNQGVLLNDWTPYLDSMPNFSSIVNMSDADRPGQPSIAKIMMTGDENNLQGLWTLPDPPSWSLKIREDWADEYRATTEDKMQNGQVVYPAGATATDGGPWQPDTPEDLLNFARFIKYEKNENPNDPTYFGFSTAGENTDFGVLGTWIPLMYGMVSQLPWGIYFDEEGNVDFGITDGTHKKMLDFIETIIEEELIEPNWYHQSAADKTTNSGHIGIEWYPGEITENTQAYFTRNNIIDEATGEIVDTTDWWHTYPVPKDPDSPNGGYQPSDGFFGQIITVSAKAANDSAKMEKICAFLDDLAMTKSTDANGETVYNRSDAYNALRWGVGIEEDLEFQEIEGTNQVYLYTGDEGREERTYRSQYPGAWDWGAFFRSADDGVVQGSSSPTVSRTIERVVEQDALTASYERKLQYGGVLQLDTSLITSLTTKMQAFEYRYVTSHYSAAEAISQYESFQSDWLASGGNSIFAEAEQQFRRLGFIS